VIRAQGDGAVHRADRLPRDQADDPDGKLLKNYDLSNFARCSWRASAAIRRPSSGREASGRAGGRSLVADRDRLGDCGNFQGLDPMPVKLGSTHGAVPGWHLDVLDENGHPMKPGEVGALAGKLPLPPGTFPTLWNADERYRQSYMSEFPGYYKTGDAGFIDPDGYVSVMTRVDDVINVAGHRLSTGQIEEVLGAHADVAECAVIGIADDLKGQVPLGFLVLKAGVNRPPQEITAEVVQMVRDRIGPVAFFKSALVVQRLPKTRSGKILRGTMQKMADSQPWTLPATIEDPAVLDEIKDGLKVAGFANK
jgi:propionyl-CoA synthetase